MSTQQTICPRTGLLWTYACAGAQCARSYLAVLDNVHPLFSSEAARNLLFRDIADRRYCKPSTIPAGIIAAKVLWHCTALASNQYGAPRGLSHRNPALLARLHSDLTRVRYSTLYSLSKAASVTDMRTRHRSLEEMVDDVTAMMDWQKARYIKRGMSPLVGLLEALIHGATPEGLAQIAATAADIREAEREVTVVNEADKAERAVASITQSMLDADGPQWLSDCWRTNLKTDRVAAGHLATYRNLLTAPLADITALQNYMTGMQDNDRVYTTETKVARYTAIARHIAKIAALRAQPPRGLTVPPVATDLDDSDLDV